MATGQFVRFAKNFDQQQTNEALNEFNFAQMPNIVAANCICQTQIFGHSAPCRLIYRQSPIWAPKHRTKRFDKFQFALPHF